MSKTLAAPVRASRAGRGYEVEHVRILRTMRSGARQRAFARELLVMVLFVRATRSPWARAADEELAAMVGR